MTLRYKKIKAWLQAHFPIQAHGDPPRLRPTSEGSRPFEKSILSVDRQRRHEWAQSAKRPIFAAAADKFNIMKGV